MAQYFSQPFPKPGRNVFTLLWTTLYFQRHVHEAAANGHLKIVRYFHRLGADIEARDTEDRRPLWLAAQVGVTLGSDYHFLNSHGPQKSCIVVMHSTADLWCIQCHVNPMR